MNPSALSLEPVEPRGRPAPWLLVRTGGGLDLHLCDFASVGAAGEPYLTWLPMA